MKSALPSGRVVEAILFDVDGVVVESELLHLATFNEVLAPLQISISDQEWRERFLGAGSNSIINTIFQEHGISENPTTWVERRRHLYQQHVAKGELSPIKGFPSFYETALTMKFPIAFVSTGHPKNIAVALECLGIEGKHPVIDGTQVHRLKPDPEAYLLGAQTLNVPPRHCLVFEDSPIGIAAAKAADMLCVALTTTNSPSDLEAADFIIENFDNWTIEKILQKVNAQAMP